MSESLLLETYRAQQQQAITAIMAQREDICQAWIAFYDYPPKDVVQIITTRMDGSQEWHLEAKDGSDPTKSTAAHVTIVHNDLLRKIDELLDLLDREGGDAPHRTVNRMERIRLRLIWKQEEMHNIKKGTIVEYEAGKSPIPKPPIGLTPARLCNFYSDRIETIENAMHRYRKADLKIPPMWSNELLTLRTLLNDSQRAD